MKDVPSCRVDSCPYQQPILDGDRLRNLHRPDPISLSSETNRAHHVDRERAVSPASKLAGITHGEIVTARKYRDARAGGGRALEHAVRQRTARVTGHHEISGVEPDVVDVSWLERHATRQARPRGDERI